MKNKSKFVNFSCENTISLDGSCDGSHANSNK